MQALIIVLLAHALLQSVQAPVLEFPEAGLDDPAAYQGYATRFFRDSHGNTFQIYLDTRVGRVVHVWADAANESAAFTVRDGAGQPVRVAWGGPGATTSSNGRERSVRWELTAEAGVLELGSFVLGTMRQERDFQYQRWHERPYADSAFVLSELRDLVTAVQRLTPAVRARHLALLAARDVAELRGRLEPRVTLTREPGAWLVRVEHTSLDGRNHLRLEFRGAPSAAEVAVADGRVSVRARGGRAVRLDVTVTTDAAPLTPLGRNRLFNAAFEAYYATERHTADSLDRALSREAAARDPRIRAFRRFDRQVRGLALLSYEEKLIASMPNYATYFGRDMMMSALMLEPIVAVDVQENVIASMLRKLSPDGQVSHEEALGGQAIREHAVEYAALIGRWAETRAPSLAAARLDSAAALLQDLQAVRENYRMVDDDFQLPVLTARYVARPDVTPERKRRFLTADDGSGASRLDALVRNLGFVTTLVRPYADHPTPMNLVAFFHRDADGWFPGSWRDSRVGYGDGRFAMDVNAIWAPAALEALRTIDRAVGSLGLSLRERVVPAGAAAALAAYLDDPVALDSAVVTWQQAWRHFEVRRDAGAIRQDVERMLTALPETEQTFWRRRLVEDSAVIRPLAFLAVALDDAGQPVAVANTDPATALFLGSFSAEIAAGQREVGQVLALLDVMGRPYPVGLFVPELGPLVANDAYARPAVQERFRNDLYHSPRVVWGREVNLLVLGLARQLAAAHDASGGLRGDAAAMRGYVAALADLLERTQAAVEASGLRHNELWSYRIEGDTLRPERYGTSSDIQLWNVTDLAVRFLLDRLPSR